MTQPEGMDSVPFDMNEVLDGLAIENGRLRAQLRVAHARINVLLNHINGQEQAAQAVETPETPAADTSE